MCRSIKTLRPLFVEDPGDDDVRAAALQYVRKISGFRAPGAGTARRSTKRSSPSQPRTRELLDRLEVRTSTTRSAG